MARMYGRRIAWAGTVIRFDDGSVWAVEFDGRGQWIEAEISTTEDYDEDIARFGSRVFPRLTRRETEVRVRGSAARWVRGEEAAPPTTPDADAIGPGPLAIESG